MVGWVQAAWQIRRRRGRGVGRVVLWGVVIAWAFHLWFRAPSPVWTSAVIPGGTVPVGFTADRKLVTVDGQQTGQSIGEFRHGPLRRGKQFIRRGLT